MYILLKHENVEKGVMVVLCDTQVLPFFFFLVLFCLNNISVGVFVVSGTSGEFVGLTINIVGPNSSDVSLPGLKSTSIGFCWLEEHLCWLE